MADQNQPPKHPGSLSDEQLQRAATRLNEKVANGGVCRICQKGPVNVGPDFVAPPVWLPGGGMSIGGPSYPQIMTVCTNCGNTQLYNAVALGVLTGGDE